MAKKYIFQILLFFALAILVAIVFTLILKTKPLALSGQNKSQLANNNMPKKSIIRQPTVAGSFYPADASELKAMINEFLAAVPASSVSTDMPRVLIVPHAGYQYSGPVAAYSFKQLTGINIKRAIIIGPSHHFADPGLFLSGAGKWQTPLGLVKVAEVNLDLAKENNFSVNEEIHEPEHALELEVPFLQIVLPGIEIEPIIVGQLNTSQRTDFASVLNKYLDDQTVLIVSVDMSHYYPQAQALALDNQSINHILSLDDLGILNDEIDAPWAVASVLELAKQNGWQPKLLKHATSGDITGDQSAVVGYGAVGFYGEVRNQKSEIRNQGEENSGDEYTQAEKTELLQMARTAIEKYLTTDGIYTPKTDNQKFLAKRGVFVTLTKNAKLRGCIGYIEPIKPLIRAVVDNAISAAVHDPRFSPVTASEIKDVEIEISVLTLPQPDTVDDIAKNKLGAILENGRSGATYLPQVWADLKDPGQFFSSLCLKGGMSGDCFNDAATKVYSHQAIVFHE